MGTVFTILRRKSEVSIQYLSWAVRSLCCWIDPYSEFENHGDDDASNEDHEVDDEDQSDGEPFSYLDPVDFVFTYSWGCGHHGEHETKDIRNSSLSKYNDFFWRRIIEYQKICDNNRYYITDNMHIFIHNDRWCMNKISFYFAHWSTELHSSRFRFGPYGITYQCCYTITQISYCKLMYEHMYFRREQYVLWALQNTDLPQGVKQYIAQF